MKRQTIYVFFRLTSHVPRLTFHLRFSALGFSKCARNGRRRTLLQALIAESEKTGIWTLQAGIFPENTASIRLHEKNGFRLVGKRERIGKMNAVWRDVMLMERRSDRVGI